MRSIIVTIATLSALSLGSIPALAVDATQSPLKPGSTTAQQYPKIVLYSTSWCPHCKQVKEYLTRNNIPFINRDVEIDDAAMTALTGKYKSQGVPVIVFGDDKVILKGFSEERFTKALKEAQPNK